VVDGLGLSSTSGTAKRVGSGKLVSEPFGGHYGMSVVAATHLCNVLEGRLVLRTEEQEAQLLERGLRLRATEAILSLEEISSVSDTSEKAIER
jgi:hypothetical protein